MAALLVIAAAACSGSERDAPADSRRSSGDTGFQAESGAESAAESGAGLDGEVGPGDPTTATEGSGAAPSVTAATTIAPRPDGIELVFAEGALGPARLGATIDEVAAALGPAYTISAEQTIRVGFPSGYSISSGGEVLFWAVEEGGVLTLFMSNNPKIGLESGLRPTLALADAIELHGEPTLTLGAESREFVEFEDGTGAARQVSVLVAIGEFGGPVGLYPDAGDDEGAQAEGYELVDANIKELWFSL